MSAATVCPSFVIFKDEPSSPTRVDEEETVKSTTTVVAVVTAGDKENLHPVTGRRPSTEEVSDKKRKTGALATKLLKISSRAAPEPHPSPKKRKLSVSSSTNCLLEKKEKRSASVTRRHKSKPAMRGRKTIAELPKVEEEVHAEVHEELHKPKDSPDKKDGIRASADSKCYDLTVLPLADVSKAFEQSPPPEEELVDGEESDVPQDEDNAQTAVKSSQAQSTSEVSGPDTPSKSRIVAFSTPERKRIYSAFTFESPSPAAKRYALSRGSSVDRFSDLDFSPTYDVLSLRAP